jgi:hypothetical protein
MDGGVSMFPGRLSPSLHNIFIPCSVCMVKSHLENKCMTNYETFGIIFFCSYLVLFALF